MARRTSATGSNVQIYLRIQNDDRQADLLDDTALHAHTQQMSLDTLKGLVRQAIVNANRKSSRAILNIPDGADQAMIEKIYRREGANLLKYFRKYCGDPAATAHQVLSLIHIYSSLLASMIRNHFSRQSVVSRRICEYVEDETPFLRSHMLSALKILEARKDIIVESIKSDGKPRRPGTYQDAVRINFA